MKTTGDAIKSLNQLAKYVDRARELHEQWNSYDARQFNHNQKADKEFQHYKKGLEQALKQLLADPKLKPKRWNRFLDDQDLLVEKLTRNRFSRDSRSLIAYYYAEFVAAIKFLTWLFQESKITMKLKQRWGLDALDDIEVFTDKLVSLICKHLEVSRWNLDSKIIMTRRPSHIWAVDYRKALQNFKVNGVKDWRLAPPFIRAALEIAFLEQIFYGRDLKLKEKHVPYKEIHGYLKNLSFRRYLPQLDKLLYIYEWASVHTHWAERYSVGACWFITKYVADLCIDEKLRQWGKARNKEFQGLLTKLEQDGYIIQ